MPTPIRPDDVIYPSAHSDFNSTLATLRRSHLSISNRLHSIHHDSHFVEQVARTSGLPLIANERCGSWYIRPNAKAGSAYFKSTDGHNGQWAFSLRRLNLQILDIVGEDGGCIIVDSTRRGKSMPDALLKTVPIWAAVLNRSLFPELVESHILRTPEGVVSPSEHAQIEQRLLAFVLDFKQLNLDLDALRMKLKHKPMRPIWATPDVDLSDTILEGMKENLLVLCTASGRTVTIAASDTSFEYVQGAADDSESWACGLTPALFWSHQGNLLALSEGELPASIQELVATSVSAPEADEPILVRPTRSIWLADNRSAAACYADFDVIITCSDARSASFPCDEKKHIPLECSEGKNGSRQLRAMLPRLEALADKLRPHSRVLVTCQTGRDIAVGVALALICCYCADDGCLVPTGSGPILSKTTIKHRLSWIMVSHPSAKPSRATLQSVNAFLFS